MNKLLPKMMMGLSILLLTSSLAFAKTAQKVLLIVMPGCTYCTEAKQILDSKGIKYRTTNGGGAVPRLYVDGQYKGTGVDAVESWVKKQK